MSATNHIRNESMYRLHLFFIMCVAFIERVGGWAEDICPYGIYKTVIGNKMLPD